MNYQIKLILEYKKTRNNDTFEKILLSFKPLILKYMEKVPMNYREDIYQDLLYAFLLTIDRFKIIEVKVENKYLKKFQEKYSTTLYEKANEIFKYEFNLFCNENQFIKYLNKSLANVISDFYRNYKEEFSNTVVSLNEFVYENLEQIDTIPDITQQTSSPFEKFNLTDSELEFINIFIEHGRIISEAEVARKLGISQQAVNKRKKHIIKKYSK